MVQSEDESPLIYGIEYQARALCSQTSASADNMPVRFLVGTQSLKNDNQVHFLEYQEELINGTSSCALKKLIFKHPLGEIWDISCSQKFPNLLTTCHASQSTQTENIVQNNCTLWKLPIDIDSTSLDEDNFSNSSLIKLCDFNVPENESSFLGNKNGLGVRKCLWQPEDGDQLLTMEAQRLVLWDVNTNKYKQTFNFDSSHISKLTSKSYCISNFRWSPHSNCSIIGLAVGNCIYAKDVRSKHSDFAWSIDAHSQLVRDLDFNPNAQYYLASCGDDCQYKFWDVRNTKEPAISMQTHSHWVWSVRYNQYHDQLVLTCSSDSRVILSRIASFASQPFGHLLEDTDELSCEDLHSDEEEICDNLSYKTSIKKRKLKDEVVTVYDDHEDSVYAAEWSNADPWIFASLGYDGRLVINKVCKEEKYNLLI